MPSTRSLLTAVAFAAALVTVTACGPSDDKGSAPAASKSAGAKATPTAGTPADPAADPNQDCGNPPKLPAGHKMLHPIERPKQNTMHAQDAKPACTPNDWIYHGEGPHKPYWFEKNVTAELATGSGQTKKVELYQLWDHIGDCLANDHEAVKPPLTCSGGIYDVTLNAKGNVVAIKEIWHP
ncbi:hypothetical protein ACGFRG_31920 [Streptomyces sp. NPDC048696]|uniref:hypothetical protein n=1 Tax=Streptomyces sp. NPDC048696 TaxID=3365585 RepID=UPI003723D742